MTSERAQGAGRFLARAGFAAARREPLVGDASTRRYERLYPAAGPSLILMDQPPNVESPPCPPAASGEERARLGFNALYRLAAGRIEAFVACAAWLRRLGLSAPQVLAADPAAGFAILEDLGNDFYASLLAAGAQEAPLYDVAIDVLVRLHAEVAPLTLEGDGACWPLLSYDALALQAASDLFIQWQPQFDRRLDFGGEARAEWAAIFDPVRARGAAGASVFCHRDFHAENLLWLPGREGPARCGLIDFQDALRAHPAWDLSMLLHDARRQISPEREAAALRRYFVLRPELERDAFLADFQALGALNVARILGIFARLVVRDRKPRYGAFMPRLWRYLDRCAAPPGPAGLAGWLARHTPAEARA